MQTGLRGVDSHTVHRETVSPAPSELRQSPGAFAVAHLGHRREQPRGVKTSCRKTQEKLRKREMRTASISEGTPVTAKQ